MVYGLVLRVMSSGFGVYELWFMVYGLVLRELSSGFGVKGKQLRGKGLKFKTWN
jgi:hypothetical protein